MVFRQFRSATGGSHVKNLLMERSPQNLTKHLTLILRNEMPPKMKSGIRGFRKQTTQEQRDLGIPCMARYNDHRHPNNGGACPWEITLGRGKGWQQSQPMGCPWWWWWGTPPQCCPRPKGDGPGGLYHFAPLGTGHQCNTTRTTEAGVPFTCRVGARTFVAWHQACE